MNARIILTALGFTTLATTLLAGHPAHIATPREQIMEHLARAESHVHIIDKHLDLAATHITRTATKVPQEVLRVRKLREHRLHEPLAWVDYVRKVPGTVVVGSEWVAETDRINESTRSHSAEQEADVAALGDDLNALWAKCAMLEKERSVLWTKIAFRTVADQEYSDQPLYRFELRSQSQGTSNQQRVAALQAVAQFMRSVDHLANQAQDAIDGDPQAVCVQWHKNVAAARAQLQDTLLSQATLAMEVYKPTTEAGQISADAKQLAQLAQTVVDAQQALASAEKAQDDEKADVSREQLQQSLADTAGAVEALDQAVTHAVAGGELRVFPEPRRISVHSLIWRVTFRILRKVQPLRCCQAQLLQTPVWPAWMENRLSICCECSI